MKRIFFTVTAFILLFSWVSWHYFVLLHQPLYLTGNKAHQIIGIVDSIPIYKHHHLTFSIQVKKMDGKNRKGRLRLSWYGKSPYLQEGERWHLCVKLKPAQWAKQYSNFNYSDWLLLHRFQAFGYVKNCLENKHLLNDKTTHWTYEIMRWRIAVRHCIRQSLKNTSYEHEVGLLSALTVGLKQGISQQQWQDFRNTGTSHLMAISGLHIGLCAAFIFFIASFLWRQIGDLSLWIPAQKIGYSCAWLAALTYAIMAGFALPTQRAFIMISCLLVAKLSSRNLSLLRSLLIAFFLILLWDPMAIVSASFWMSFSAVTLIAYAIHGRINPRYNFWWRYIRLQWAITLGLIPISLWFFQQASISAFITNFIAIPFVSFIIVPLALFASCMILINLQLSSLLFKIAAIALHILMMFLHKMALLPHLVLHLQLPSWISFVSMMSSVLLILTPRGVIFRFLGAVMLLCYFCFL